MIMKTKVVLIISLLLLMISNDILIAKNVKTIDLAAFESGKINTFKGNCKYDSIVFLNIVGGIMKK